MDDPHCIGRLAGRRCVMLAQFLQFLFSGVTVGATYALAADNSSRNGVDFDIKRWLACRTSSRLKNLVMC